MRDKLKETIINQASWLTPEASKLLIYETNYDVCPVNRYGISIGNGCPDQTINRRRKKGGILTKNRRCPDG